MTPQGERNGIDEQKRRGSIIIQLFSLNGMSGQVHP